jgi:hypothetical protein
MTRAELDAEIAARKAAGTLDEMDGLLMIGWQTGTPWAAGLEIP